MLNLLEDKHPKEAWNVDDPKYCLYHLIIGHPTKNYYILKDKIQPLVDANIIKLLPEQKKIKVNMVSFKFDKAPD